MREDSHHGREWGGPRWPPRLLPSVSAAEVPASSPSHKEGDRLFGHLCVKTAALRGAHTGEPHADLQAGPTWAASLVQAGSEHYTFIKANPEGPTLSSRDGRYLSSLRFQTAVVHLGAISLVFGSQ